MLTAFNSVKGIYERKKVFVVIKLILSKENVGK